MTTSSSGPRWGSRRADISPAPHLAGDLCPAWCSTHVVERDQHPDDAGVEHFSRPVDSFLPADGTQPVTVRLRHFRHDSGTDWPERVEADHVDPGFISTLSLAVPDARRLALSLLVACEIAENGPDELRSPAQRDVDALRELLDLLEHAPDNDQRARYLLTCNWMRDRGAAASAHLRASAVTR